MLHASVGLAASQNLAHLAALRAKPGEVREVQPDQEHAFLALVPISHLNVVGLNLDQIEKLHFLGIRGLTDLLSWSAARRSAFLGVDTAKVLQRFVKGLLWGVAENLTLFACIVAQHGEDRVAVKLYGAAWAICQVSSPVVWPARSTLESRLAQIRAPLRTGSQQRDWHEGLNLSRDARLALTQEVRLRLRRKREAHAATQFPARLTAGETRKAPAQAR